MKGYIKLLAVLGVGALFFAGCSKSKDSGKIILDSPAVYFSGGDQQATVTFTVRNIKTMTPSGKPEGWDAAVVNLPERTISIAIPSNEKLLSEEADSTGTFSFTGRTPGGTVVSATLFAGIVPQVDLRAKVANSYIANKPKHSYVLDAMRRGDGSQLATDHVGVIWQSASGLVQYTDFEEGKVLFFVGANANDDQLIKSGNAVIGAYNADDELIWSWHIWMTNYDPDATDGSIDFNGFKLMNRNLGSQATGSMDATTDQILSSYGLYYQWGRKDPFIGPNTYQAGSGSSAYLYNATGSRTALKVEKSSAQVGTAEYAIENPLTFITGVEESAFDWLWTGHSDNLWSGDDLTVKSQNDPCPYGWRVASERVFNGVTVTSTPAVGDEAKYGWMLSDGSAEAFFMGGGRRRYDNASIQNIYIPQPTSRANAMVAQPWEGLYWTSNAAVDNEAKALHFWFMKEDTTSGINVAQLYKRANGMQVRCVKM